jgi:hypothetical protein
MADGFGQLDRLAVHPGHQADRFCGSRQADNKVIASK